MAALYNLEPPPTAKVLLQTTSGDILLELFAKQTPLASRNFLQHCLDGYYDGTIFHRVVAGFIVQGGDPTGTGVGGESVYEDGAPFEDEFHSRLKYNRRGLLGMANSGKPNDNGSQFFLTLGVTAELAGKNTLFGRVVGDTIFNVVKMGDAELVEGGERPLYPTKITGTEILINPFEDMVKREKRTATSSGAAAEKGKKKPKRKAGKALLSFGDDEAGEADVLPVKKAKFNTALISGEAQSPMVTAQAPKQKAADQTEAPKKTQKAQEVPNAPTKPTQVTRKSPSPKPRRRQQSEDSSDDSRSASPERSKRREDLSKTQSEIAALKASLRRGGPEQRQEKSKPKTALEAMIPETSTRGRRRGAGQNSAASDEAGTLAMFKSFQSKLDSIIGIDETPKVKDDTIPDRPEHKDAEEDDSDDEAALCDLHFIVNCQSCRNWTEDDADDNDMGDGWLGHKLSFAKDRLGKDLEWKRKNEEELVVVDPREKARDLGVGRVGYSNDIKGKREWDRDKKSTLPRQQR